MEDKIILSEFSKRLSELIKDNDTDISILTSKLGLRSKTTVYRYMKGEMSPKITTVKVIADIYNVNLLWLMGYDVPKENKKENFRYASYNGINIDGLDKKEIEEINRFVEFIKTKKKNEKK